MIELTQGTTIISGAIAERTNFYFYLFFSVLNTFVFCFPARWLWSEYGFLKLMGVVDVAGSCGINIVGGAGALVGIKYQLIRIRMSSTMFIKSG